VTTAGGLGKSSDSARASEKAARRSFERLPDGELDRILDPREQKVLRLKWGLEDGREYNNREIGVELCVGDERVRQVYTGAVQKLAEELARGRGVSDG
jgi:RNA polymerase primary sigma factor